MPQSTFFDNDVVQMVFIELVWLPPKRPTRKQSTSCSIREIESKRFSLERIISLEIGLVLGRCMKDEEKVTEGRRILI
jgi:hypothetical protein